MRKLFILDLDNTLIYASQRSHQCGNILFHYSSSLTIFRRPYAEQFIGKCQSAGDVVVFSTAVKDYAEKVCRHLDIKPVALFTREDCFISGGVYQKYVPHDYFEKYDAITIFDDNPEMWDKKSRESCKVISVPPFYGEEDDVELGEISV